MLRQHALVSAIALTLLLGACSTKQTTVAEEEAQLGRQSGLRSERKTEVAANEQRLRDQAPMKQVVTAQPVAAVPEPAPMVAQPVVADSAYAPKDLAGGAAQVLMAPGVAPPPPPEVNTERYAERVSNAVKRVADEPVSTFSIDVDTGSYSNVRRMLQQGQLPPQDAVREEEFINYFDYAYQPPSQRDTPFSVFTEIAPAPWNAKRHLLLVGLKGYEVASEEIPAANLVFLIDSSGSMDSPDKIGLLKQSFIAMVPKLRSQDRISIVVYAGSAGLVLPPTPGSDHDTIIAAFDRLSAGGSTNGGAGIELAYAQAKRAFIDGGVNRVILATDGDFNVGTVNMESLKSMVAEQRRSGISLTTLGFGQGNYNDELSEQLADIGNGNHAYIDTLNEGHKVLVEEMSSTLFTIASDVKIQVEFNPAAVAEYRLIGYENRLLAREDFNNDAVDAGEIGAGHDVTALYEVSLVGSGGEQVDPLRYQPASEAKANTSELAFVKLRYKAPLAKQSTLLERAVKRQDIRDDASDRLDFAAAVAAFADRLRGGTHIGQFGFGEISRLAARSTLPDAFGYRAELLHLIDRAQSLSGEQTPVALISE